MSILSTRVFAVTLSFFTKLPKPVLSNERERNGGGEYSQSFVVDAHIRLVGWRG